MEYLCPMMVALPKHIQDLVCTLEENSSGKMDDDFIISLCLQLLDSPSLSYRLISLLERGDPPGSLAPCDNECEAVTGGLSPCR